MFWVPALIDPMAVIPTRLAHEYKNVPTTTMSFGAYMSDAMSGKLTRIDRPFNSPMYLEALRRNVAKSLSE